MLVVTQQDMIPIKSNMNEEERKRFQRECYKCDKKGLTEFYHQQGWKGDGLKTFLVNSLKGYEELLKEDGLI